MITKRVEPLPPMQMNFNNDAMNPNSIVREVFDESDKSLR